jgi:16S rRNA (adenine1518-N6/adenine1519-N6)-dimethyltransferase
VLRIERGHRPSKRLGQNFLIDQSIAQEIVASISPNRSDTVLEPGPGHGTLTNLLLQKAGKVVAIEKDPNLVSELEEKFRNQPNLTVLAGDVLKMKDSIPVFNKIVSTPPYYISSKLTLLVANLNFDLASIVFQKEFGERIIAQPGGSDYGRLTVSVTRKLKVEWLRDIPNAAFDPKPKVDSALLRFVRKPIRTELDEILFEEMVRGMFNQRRRLSKSSLLHFLSLKYGKRVAKEISEKLVIPDKRVYELTLSELENLSLQLWRVSSDRLASGRLDVSGPTATIYDTEKH